ncbi:MAG: DEAD/DEAH box helicase, partial [Hyphomicrobiales bacterium]|nr:DEAD/DEAH box helicase [Hyphomicrobiales bacterium]
MTTFTDLGLAPELLRALDTEGYTVPTPIQGKAIPPVLEGRDLLGIAQTGTGKTAAFALPILHRLAANRRPAPRKGCRVLVLSPTRELASQIAESFRAYGRHLGFSVTTVFGGVGHRPQISALGRGVDILVATPGRLIDHLEERNAVLDTCEVLVLDEADQMLDLGFVRPIRRIVKSLPQVRQNLFFSATMPKEIGELAAELLRDPARISVVPSATTAERVTQRVIHVEASRKRALLVELLGDPAMARTLVFTRTKRGADRVAKHLETAGLPAAAIHGNKSQRQRELALDAFKSGEVRTLVATDIAARGIDVDAVTHVVNYELPEVPESYVHRIGRTARAGAGGIALSLCDGEERELLRDIERVTRQKIASSDRRGDPTLAVDTARPARSERGPRGGREQEPRQGGQRSPSNDRQHGRPQHARPEGQRHRGDAPRPQGERGERNDQRPRQGGDRAANGAANGHRGQGA